MKTLAVFVTITVVTVVTSIVTKIVIMIETTVGTIIVTITAIEHRVVGGRQCRTIEGVDHVVPTADSLNIAVGN
jgi:hypothetical protein